MRRSGRVRIGTETLQSSWEKAMKPSKSASASSRFPDLLWNENDLAAAIGISVKRVQQLARQGVLPAFKVGRYWRFDPDAICTWVKQVSQTHAQPQQRHSPTPRNS